MATFVPKSTVMRLLQDVKDIIKNPLESQGIYYKHDEADMLKGTALIIGPKDTPYEVTNVTHFEFGTFPEKEQIH